MASPLLPCRPGFEQVGRLGAAGSTAHGPAGVGGGWKVPAPLSTIGKENLVVILLKTKVIGHCRNVKASP